MKSGTEIGHPGWVPIDSGALEWTRTTTPLGTGPQPAAYTIPPRGQIISFRMKFYTKPCSLSIPIDCWTGLLKSHFQLSIQACKHGRLRRPGRFFAVSAPFAFPKGRQKAQKLQKRIVQRQSLGIAFGGGGARGFAHLGVLERLLPYGIPVDYLAGCSIGVLPASLYLMGKSIAESEALFLDIHRHIVRWGFPRMSIFSNRGLKRELQKRCGDLRFEDLSTPFAMIALDLAMRTEVVLDRGPLWLAALASVSIPGIFPPVTIGKHMLIDAGVHDPVPTRAVRTMGADVLLRIDVDDREPLLLESATPWIEGGKHTPSRKSLSPHIVDVLLRAYEVSTATINMHSDLEADVVIRPQTRSVSLLQFTKGPQLVAAGREAVEQLLPALRELFPWVV